MDKQQIIRIINNGPRVTFRPKAGVKLDNYSVQTSKNIHSPAKLATAFGEYIGTGKPSNFEGIIYDGVKIVARVTVSRQDGVTIHSKDGLEIVWSENEYKKEVSKKEQYQALVKPVYNNLNSLYVNFVTHLINTIIEVAPKYNLGYRGYRQYGNNFHFTNVQEYLAATLKCTPGQVQEKITDLDHILSFEDGVSFSVEEEGIDGLTNKPKTIVTWVGKVSIRLSHYYSKNLMGAIELSPLAMRNKNLFMFEFAKEMIEKMDPSIVTLVAAVDECRAEIEKIQKDLDYNPA